MMSRCVFNNFDKKWVQFFNEIYASEGIFENNPYKNGGWF